MIESAGWETVFVCVDDHTGLAYAEVLTREDTACATAFLQRALRWFESVGIQAERILSDNAKCYGSHAFRQLCEARGIRQIFTRPLGLSQALPDFGPTNRCAPTLGDRVQSPRAPSGPRHGSADGSPQGGARTTSLETTARMGPWSTSPVAADSALIRARSSER